MTNQDEARARVKALKRQLDRVRRLHPEATATIAALEADIRRLEYESRARDDRARFFFAMDAAGPGLRRDLEALRLALAAAAQAVVDAWDPSGEDGDPELGFGGVCDRVAAALAEVIVAALGDRVDVLDGGQDGDDHAYLVVVPVDSGEPHAFEVDVPPEIYETGGGYLWRKVEGADIGPEDVIIHPVPREWFSDRTAAAPLSGRWEADGLRVVYRPAGDLEPYSAPWDQVRFAEEQAAALFSDYRRLHARAVTAWGSADIVTEDGFEAAMPEPTPAAFADWLESVGRGRHPGAAVKDARALLLRLEGVVTREERPHGFAPPASDAGVWRDSPIAALVIRTRYRTVGPHGDLEALDDETLAEEPLDTLPELLALLIEHRLRHVETDPLRVRSELLFDEDGSGVEYEDTAYLEGVTPDQESLLEDLAYGGAVRDFVLWNYAYARGFEDARARRPAEAEALPSALRGHYTRGYRDAGGRPLRLAYGAGGRALDFDERDEEPMTADEMDRTFPPTAREPHQGPLRSPVPAGGLPKHHIATAEYRVTGLTDTQLGALEVYIFDPAHAEVGDVFPGFVKGRTLHVEKEMLERARELLIEGANSADASGDKYFTNALSAVVSKLTAVSRTAAVSEARARALLLEAGPPVEWSGGVVSALEAEDAKDDVKALWESMSADEQQALAKEWADNFGRAGHRRAQVERLEELRSADRARIEQLNAEADRLDREALEAYERAHAFAMTLQRVDLDDLAAERITRAVDALQARAEELDAEAAEVRERLESFVAAVSEDGEPPEGSTVPEDLLRPFAATFARFLSRNPNDGLSGDRDALLRALRGLALEHGADPGRITDDRLYEAASDAYDRLFALRRWRDPRFKTAAPPQALLPGRSFELKRPLRPKLMGWAVMPARGYDLVRMTRATEDRYLDPPVPSAWRAPDDVRVHLVGTDGRVWYLTLLEMQSDALVPIAEADDEGGMREMPDRSVPPQLRHPEDPESTDPGTERTDVVAPTSVRPAPSPSQQEVTRVEPVRRQSAATVPLAYSGMLTYTVDDARHQRGRHAPPPARGAGAGGHGLDRPVRGALAGAGRGAPARVHGSEGRDGPHAPVRGQGLARGAPRAAPRRAGLRSAGARVTAEVGQGLLDLTDDPDAPDERAPPTPESEPARWTRSYPADDTVGVHLGQRQAAVVEFDDLFDRLARDDVALREKGTRAAQRAPWVAVDLDGTVLEAPDPASYETLSRDDQPALGAPLPGAAEALRELAALGWRVSVYTARFGDEELDPETIERWAEEIAAHLDAHQVPFSDIWVGRKPRADAFIDDKAVAFDGDWAAALAEVTKGDHAGEAEDPRAPEPGPGPTRASGGPLAYPAEESGDWDPLGERANRGVWRVDSAGGTL